MEKDIPGGTLVEIIDLKEIDEYKFKEALRVELSYVGNGFIASLLDPHHNLKLDYSRLSMQNPRPIIFAFGMAKGEAIEKIKKKIVGRIELGENQPNYSDEYKSKILYLISNLKK